MYITGLLCTTLLVSTICNMRVSALNILGIFPYPGRSHLLVFKVLLHELSRRGHNLTVISHVPESDASENYRDISLAGTAPIVEDQEPLETKGLIFLIGAPIYLSSIGRSHCDLMLKNNEVVNLVKEKHKFDVVLVEQFNSDCGLGVAYKLGAPVVALTSHILLPWHYDRFGIPSNPSFVAFHFLGGGTRPSLFQKVERTIWNKYYRLIFYFLCQRYNHASLEKLFGEMPALEDLGRDIKVLLLYQHHSLTGTSLLPSNVIEVGGYHIADAKPLTGELLKFIEDAEDGIVYVSFGSMVKVSSMSQQQLQAILEAFAVFPHRFIWRWDDNTISTDKPPFNNLPEQILAMLTSKKKIYTAKWLPQIDILGHQKTVAFFSHAGMASATEAFHFGVPIVAMPVVGDQPANAAAIEESGLGIQLQVDDLSKENLEAALKKVLDPIFHERVKRLAKVWHDRPQSPLDTAVYWVEHVARNSNHTFRTPAADVPLYQYLNLDVVAVFIVVVFCTYFMVKLLASFCHTEITKNKKKSAHSTQKKRT